ncbi:MAG: hypothetical protein ACETVZ_00230 [Phycisphaerae bacterium]
MHCGASLSKAKATPGRTSHSYAWHSKGMAIRGLAEQGKGKAKSSKAGPSVAK